MDLNETKLLINPSVRQLKAYHLEPEITAIKLNQNENPFDWPEVIKKEMAQFCLEQPWNRYPPFIPEELKTLLANYVGVKASNVIAGNGSNEILLTLLLSLVNKTTHVILCQPTFTVYKLLLDGIGADVSYVNLKKDLTYDIEAICNEIGKFKNSLLILCTPNNPTGCSLSQDDILKILEQHTGICVLDQAYIEFGGFNAIPLLSKYPNLLITRTFSKAFAGAGLRLGYLIGNEEIIREINKIKLPYNINMFTEHLAKILLKNQNAVAPTLKILAQERDSLVSFLSKFPFTNVYPSDANFICVRLDKKQEFFNFLKEKGILIRDVSSYPMLENCLRISVGTPDENSLLKESIETFFKEVIANK